MKLFTLVVLANVAVVSYANAKQLLLPTTESLRCQMLLATNPLTRALKPSEIKSLELSHDEVAHSAQVIAAIQEGRWSDEIFSPTHMFKDQIPRIALHAYLQGHLTLDQFATQSMRWSAMVDFIPKSSEVLQPEPAFTPEGSPSEALRLRFLDQWPLNENATVKEAFLAKAKALPLSEQSLWSYPGTMRPGLKNQFEFWSLFYGEVIASRLGNFETDFLVRFPSFGLIRVFFETVFSENDFHLIPQLGQTDEAEVLKGIREGGRSVTLNLPGLDGVLDAHGSMGRFEAIAHDLIHNFEGVFLPKPYRLALAEFPQLVRNLRSRLNYNSGYFTLPWPKTAVVNGKDVQAVSLIANRFAGDWLHILTNGVLDLNVTIDVLSTNTRAQHKLAVIAAKKMYRQDANYFFLRDFSKVNGVESPLRLDGGTIVEMRYFLPFISQIYLHPEIFGQTFDLAKIRDGLPETDKARDFISALLSH